MSLKGKVTVIAGGEGPLGREITKKFLANGANVVIGWYAQDEWKEAKMLIPSNYSGRFIDVRFDTTNEEHVEKLMKTAKDTFNSIDHLVYTVGHINPETTLWETELATWEMLMDVNLKGAFLCAKHALRVMLENRKGRIIVFPSMLVENPGPRRIPYTAAKMGLLAIVRGLREELKDTDITVNALMLGAMDTFRTRKMATAVPIGQRVKPSDVAEVAYYICSDEGRMVNGAMIRVPGKI